jgi:hypothetical protein
MANKWTFVVAVYNSVIKTWQVYINGVVQTFNGDETIGTNVSVPVLGKLTLDLLV